MKAINSSPIRMAPQRRNRGTRTSTAPSVSAIPTTSANGTPSEAGSISWAMRCAQACVSMIFHKPEARNRTASRMAATQLSLIFQPGNSTARKRKHALPRLCHTDVHGLIVAPRGCAREEMPGLRLPHACRGLHARARPWLRPGNWSTRCSPFRPTTGATWIWTSGSVPRWSKPSTKCAPARTRCGWP